MAHFFCQVGGKGQPKNISGTAESGLKITAAGELGALRIHLFSTSKGDRFEVTFEPWRGSRNSGAHGVTLAYGSLDYDKFKSRESGNELVVYLGDEVLEAFNFCKAKEVMTRE